MESPVPKLATPPSKPSQRTVTSTNRKNSLSTPPKVPEKFDYNPKNKYYIFSKDYLSFDKKEEGGKEEVGNVLQTLILLLDVQKHLNQQDQGGTEAQDKKEWENALNLAIQLSNFDSEKKQKIRDLKKNETARLDFLMYRMGTFKGDKVANISSATKAGNDTKKAALYSEYGWSRIGAVPQTKHGVNKEKTTPDGYDKFLEEIKQYIRENEGKGFGFLDGKGENIGAEEENKNEEGQEESKSEEKEQRKYEVVFKFLKNAYGENGPEYTDLDIDTWWIEETKESTSPTPTSSVDVSPAPILSEKAYEDLDELQKLLSYLNSPNEPRSKQYKLNMYLSDMAQKVIKDQSKEEAKSVFKAIAEPFKEEMAKIYKENYTEAKQEDVDEYVNDSIETIFTSTENALKRPPHKRMLSFEQDVNDQVEGAQEDVVSGQQQGADVQVVGAQEDVVAGQQQGAVAGQQQQGGGANSAGEIDDQEITDVAPTGAFDPLPPEQLKSLQLEHFGYAAVPDTHSTLESRGTTGYGQDNTRTQAVMPFSNAMKSIPKDANANLNLQFKQQIKNSGYFVGPYSVVDVSKQTDERASKQPEQEILQPAAKRYAKLDGKIVWIPFHVRAAQTFFQEADYSELASFVVEQDNQLKLSPPPKNLPGNMMVAIKTFRNNLTNMLGLNTAMPKFNSIEDRYAEWLELKQFGKAYARYCETSAGKYNTLSLFSGNLRDAISKAVSESAERLGLTKRKAPNDDKPTGVRGLDQYGKNQPVPLENMETNPFFLPPVNDVKRQRTTFSRFY